MNFVFERHYLTAYDCSFAERIYSLKHVSAIEPGSVLPEWVWTHMTNPFAAPAPPRALRPKPPGMPLPGYARDIQAPPPEEAETDDAAGLGDRERKLSLARGRGWGGGGGRRGGRPARWAAGAVGAVRPLRALPEA